MILDFGSINMDLVMAVAALPRPGETVLCDGYVTKPGGKGSNQAVAAARAGAKVAMAGAVGDDGFGQVMRATLASEGIDTALLATSDRPTGVAYICVDARAENFIAVGSGANLAVRADQVPDDRLTPDTLLVLQMELPPEQNWALLQRARARGCRAILNVAPAAPVPEAALRDLDLLVVNEHEALAIAGGLGLDATSPRAAAQALSGRMSLTCVVTLGGKGAIAVGPDLGDWGAGFAVPALPIQPVDTTGAGDTFTGVLAAGLDAGLPLDQALRRASTGAALACLALGAQESMPTAAAIDAALPRLGPTTPIG
ncbi:ribokinase [Inquilinus sp. NPDC058860]|uniref:ribokinase n=1 Tax=Inquilinus sp. NPDC058860 TaxID=3346652 RepID=UPI0036B87C6B